MVENSAVKLDLPVILLVSNEGTESSKLLFDRLTELGHIDRDSLVWKFNTKYYTAEVKVVKVQGDSI